MSNQEKLAEYLGAHEGAYYCDDCLSVLADVTNRRQVNQIARRLEHVQGFERRRAPCTACGKVKECTVYLEACRRAPVQSAAQPQAVPNLAGRAKRGSDADRTRIETPNSRRLRPEAAITDMYSGNTRELGGHQFQLVGVLEPERAPGGGILALMPQGRYAKAATAELHRYGYGPFCRFRLNAPARTGVYLLLGSDGDVRYVGECSNLAHRFNAGYGQISPRKCYQHGQETNCRVNNLVLNATEQGERIEQLQPEWNRHSSVSERFTRNRSIGT